jgi:hypothetical protein
MILRHLKKPEWLWLSENIFISANEFTELKIHPHIQTNFSDNCDPRVSLVASAGLREFANRPAWEQHGNNKCL